MLQKFCLTCHVLLLENALAHIVLMIIIMVGGGDDDDADDVVIVIDTTKKPVQFNFYFFPF